MRYCEVIPYEEDPPFLGGPPPNGPPLDDEEVKIPFDADLYYFRESFPFRKASLPKPRSMTFKNEVAEKLFMDIWEGKFVMRCAEETGDNGMKLYIFKASSLDNDEKILFTQIFNVLSTSSHAVTTWSTQNEEGTVFDTCLDLDQRRDLYWRSLHRFYRRHGAAALSAAGREVIFKEVSKFYSKEGGMWTEKIDLTIAYVDAEFNNDPCPTSSNPRHMGVLLSKVGEALEEKGKFYEAALVYEDVLNPTVPYTDPPGMCTKLTLAYFAALAYKRTGEFDKAEARFLQSLRFDVLERQSQAPLWNINDDETNNVLNNLLQMYGQLFLIYGEKKRLAASGDSSMNEFDDINIKFPLQFTHLSGLLHFAGFKPHPKQQHWLTNAGQVKSFFKRDLIGSKNGLLCLKAAFGADSVTEYHKRMAICVQPGKQVQFHSPPYDPASLQHYVQNYKKSSKSRLRQDTADKARSAALLTDRCSNPDCERGRSSDSRLLRCPCHFVQYCRKSCQVSHWKDHKKVCSFHLNKQQLK